MTKRSRKPSAKSTASPAKSSDDAATLKPARDSTTVDHAAAKEPGAAAPKKSAATKPATKKASSKADTAKQPSSKKKGSSKQLMKQGSAPPVGQNRDDQAQVDKPSEKAPAAQEVPSMAEATAEQPVSKPPKAAAKSASAMEATSAAKKTATTKKAAANKTAAKKTSAKKTPAKKTSAKKTSPSKAASEKPSEQQTAASVSADAKADKETKAKKKASAKHAAPIGDKKTKKKASAAKKKPTAAKKKPTATKKKPAKKVTSQTAANASNTAAAGRRRSSGLGVEIAPRSTTLSVPSIPIPVKTVPKKLTLEQRAKRIEARIKRQSDEFRARYQESFDMSWIYHDTALEGVVYTYDELTTAFRSDEVTVVDSSVMPIYDAIRRYKNAIEYARDFAQKPKAKISIDLLKRLYLLLRPEMGDLKSIKYRRDVPQHRLYFHDYAAPDKIAYRIRATLDWVNKPETIKNVGVLRMAAKAHYDLARAYPFEHDSGKIARLLMNILLLRGGLPPAIIHATERQRYYESLKAQSPANLVAMLLDSVENAISSIEKKLHEYETRTRSFIS